jgi:small subunit ribosomal protein S28e
MIFMAEEQPKSPAASPAAPAQPQQQPMFSGFLAEIVEINETVKTGIYGEIYTVSCKIMEGKDKSRIIRRNMLGPAKVGDIIRLPDTSREAREIKVK